MDQAPGNDCRRIAVVCFAVPLLLAQGCVRDVGGDDASTSPADDGSAPTPLSLTAPQDAIAEATAPLTAVPLGTASPAGGSGNVNVSNDAPGDGFAVGTHTVVWTATDASGAVASAAQGVVVTDTTAPVITAPADVTADANGPLTSVVLGTAVATDLVDGAVAVSHDAPLDGFPVGSHTVVWTAADAAGNSGTVSQSVTINAPAGIAGDAASGATLYAANCMGCHGADPAQNLANILNGDRAENIVAAIRTVPAMAPLSSLGDDAQSVADIAAYLAEVKAGIPLTGDIAAGRLAYQQDCSGCHGDNLAENRSKILNGDNVPVLRNALMTVPSMATLAALLDEPQTLADLAAFIAEEKARSGNTGNGVGLIPEPAACAATPATAVPNVVRRLTRFEYRNTLLDLLAVDVSDQLDLLPIETRPAGFSNDALSLIVTFEHIEAYNALAAIVAERASIPALVAAHASCTDADTACYDSFVAGLGESLYRAPVDMLEVVELRELFVAAAAEGQSFNQGASMVLRAMLQAPRFLYRAEAAPAPGSIERDLAGFELASRLSYLIWASAPDAALLDKARNGELGSADALLAEANRMLADPRARRVTRRLVREWFDLDLVATLERSAIEHPDFNTDIAGDMQREAEALFDRIIWIDQAPLVSAYNRTETYATQRLADYYGLGAPVASLGDGSNVYTLTDASERSGLLTMGAVAAVSGGRDASLVHRGLFVLNRVMCTSVQQPPAGLDTTPPPVVPGESARTHSEARIANAVCGGCHYQIDPLGYPFDRLDAAAARRSVDGEGNALSAGGAYEEPGIGLVSFGNARDFANALTMSPTVQDCAVVKPTQFAFGRAFEPASTADACYLADVKSRANGSTASYHDIIRAIVASDAFRRVAAQ